MALMSLCEITMKVFKGLQTMQVENTDKELTDGFGKVTGHVETHNSMYWSALGMRKKTLKCKMKYHF